MQITIQKGKSSSGIELQDYDYGFFGEVLDDRGAMAVKTLKEKCNAVVKVSYEPEDFKVSFDDQTVDIDDIEELTNGYFDKNCLLDATTLGFVEILVLSKSLIPKRGLDYLYIEPGEYFRPEHTNILHKRDFELSGEIKGFKAIPGFSALITDDIDHKVVFILGFESSRVEKAFEDHQMINKKDCDLIFGFPAFNPGWEMNSFANHIDLIQQYSIQGDIKFGAATDPLATYSIIKKIDDSLETDKQLFISPLGTKPMAIGCALFVSENPDTAILYDHPQKKPGRSTDTNIWHLYKIDSK
ncbi:hypothetical protein [Marinoscillum sp.]|uniref:hypothetical protein n=1 Tax=Marinoscillum sp. TaxID=2024838 RepID=UPI003BAD1B18